MTRTLVLGTVLLLFTTGLALANWRVDPEAGQGCVMVSNDYAVHDGYQDTVARILVDRSTVRVWSRSILDPGFGDLGIQVDDEPFHPADRVEGERTAVFESAYQTLVEAFKRGREARVQLRFWPTWPVTGTHSFTASLIGFTATYEEMTKACG